MTKEEVSKLTYEEAVDKLENVVTTLESGSAALDKSIELYTLGAILKDHCQAKLNSAEEKISLSDRFGLWLGFYQCSQLDYLNIVNSYASYFKFKIDDNDLKNLAIEWSVTRGSRSGRVAWQFIQDLAGKQKIKLRP